MVSSAVWVEVASCGGATDGTGKVPITGDKQEDGALALSPEREEGSEVCFETFRCFGADMDGSAGLNTEMPRVSKTLQEAFLRMHAESMGRVIGTSAVAFPEIAESLGDCLIVGCAASLAGAEEVFCDLGLPLCSHPPTHSPINRLSYLEVDIASFEVPLPVMTLCVSVVSLRAGGNPCTDLTAGGPASGDIGCLDEAGFMEDKLASVGRLRACGTSSLSASVSEVFRD